MLAKSRFNPAAGLADFWTFIRRPTPYRWTFLALSILPAAGMVYWGMNSTSYGQPERPKITYITTLDPARSDAQIAAENRDNQLIRDLRAAEEERIAQAKRDLYKSLGKGVGMDVEAIEAEAEAERAAEAAKAAREREALIGAGNSAAPASESGGQ